MCTCTHHPDPSTGAVSPPPPKIHLQLMQASVSLAYVCVLFAVFRSDLSFLAFASNISMTPTVLLSADISVFVGGGC